MKKTTRQTYVNVHRDAWVEVNLESLAQNVKMIKKCVKKGVKVLAVVKADCYGHGAVMLAPTLLASGIDMLGVASIDEGLDLRDSQIDAEILVLGAAPVWAFESAAKNNITLSIFSDEHLEAARQVFERTGCKTKAYVKLDTGMNRIGISGDEAVDFIKKVQNTDFIDLQGIFSHLAMAEDEKETQIQFDRYDYVVNRVDTKGLTLHILNTAGIMSYPEKQMNMVRAGIALYGLMPDLPKCSDYKEPLKQLISLKGRIIRIHTMKKGDGVSYGHTFIADKDTIVATVPVGYADGVPRALSNKIFAKLNGKKIKQIGNITMDQMMFDITGVEAKEGDVVTLLDEELSIDEWAKIVGTINYELTCRLKVRLPRVYTR